MINTSCPAGAKQRELTTNSSSKPVRCHLKVKTEKRAGGVAQGLSACLVCKTLDPSHRMPKSNYSILWFECEMSPVDSHTWANVLQMVELLGKAVEPSEGGGLLEEVGPWGQVATGGFMAWLHFLFTLCFLSRDALWCVSFWLLLTCIPCLWLCLPWHGGLHPSETVCQNAFFLPSRLASRHILSWDN